MRNLGIDEDEEVEPLGAALGGGGDGGGGPISAKRSTGYLGVTQFKPRYARARRSGTANTAYEARASCKSRPSSAPVKRWWR